MYIRVFHSRCNYMHYACLMFSLPSHPHTAPSIMYMYTLAISIGYMDWETSWMLLCVDPDEAHAWPAVVSPTERSLEDSSH